MVDTPRTISQLQALFADNSTGNISPQDLRDFVVSTDVGVFNVKAYGAVGDGVTDDYAAIQAAIDAADAAGGGTVFFPNRNHVVGSALTLAKTVDTAANITFLGTGPGSRLTTTAAINLFDISTTVGNIRGLRWAHLMFALNDVGAVGIHSSNMAYSRIDSLRVTGVGVGLNLSGSTTASGNQIRDLVFTSVGRAMIIGTYYTTISNITMLEGFTGYDPIEFTATSGFTNLTGFQVRGDGGGAGGSGGVIVVAGPNINISDGTIYNAYKDGVYVTGGVDGVTIRGVSILGPQQRGIVYNGNNGYIQAEVSAASAAGAGLYPGVLLSNTTNTIVMLQSVGTNPTYDVQETGSNTGNVVIMGASPNGVSLDADTNYFVAGELAVTTKAGFYGTAPIVQQTGVAVSAAGVHAALVNLGLITA